MLSSVIVTLLLVFVTTDAFILQELPLERRSQRSYGQLARMSRSGYRYLPYYKVSFSLIPRNEQLTKYQKYCKLDPVSSLFNTLSSVTEFNSCRKGTL
uniref:Secreted protein n=1 Tax=Syphacia muris TaxID=451379 RepID=A0A0N5A887_9BILA